MVNIASSFLIAAGLLIVTMGTAAAEDATAACDRLAGSPLDPTRIGDGVSFDALDFAAAEAPCREAAAANPAVPRLQFELARVLQAKGDNAPAVKAYETLAAGGYSVAALALGRYSQSDGPDQDYAKAAVYFRQAIAAGINAAATDLAVLSMNGLGVPLDYAESVRLLAGPVAAGDAHSQQLLGYLYENGLGVEADLGRAAELYRQASAQDDGAAEYSLGYLYDVGQGVEENTAEALRLYRQSADDDYAFALVAIGDMYVDGRGVPKDAAEAERFYRQAVDSGDSDAAPAGKNALAWNWALAGINLPEAERLASEAVDATSEPEATYLDTRGWVRHRLGREEDAAKDLEHAVALKDSFAPYHDRLGDIYAALGRSADARSQWQKALDLPPPKTADEPTWDRDAVVRKVTGS